MLIALSFEPCNLPAAPLCRSIFIGMEREWEVGVQVRLKQRA